MSYELSAAQWQREEGFLPGRPGWVGVTAKDNRTLVNGGPRFHEGRLCGCCAAVLSGKTCPPGYGNWKSVHKRFTRWARSGIWEKIFQVLLDDPDNSYVMIDSTIVRAHQQAACGKGGAKVRLWAAPAAD